MAEFDVTDEERLKIAQHFLLSSPPSQFQEVLTDVRKLLPEGILTEALETGIARAYNVKNGKVVTAPSGAKVCIASAGEVDETHYVDPTSGAVFAVDHLSLTTSEDAGASNQDESLELKRSAMQEAVGAYVTGRYTIEQASGQAHGVSAGSCFAKSGQIFITITGERPNLRNFWSGKWHSSWTVSFAGGGSASISGDIKVHAHYFEDGNVQLQSAKNCPAASLSFSSEADLAQAVVNHIKTCESALQNGLGDMYSSMSEETFRAMRRVLPVTRTKMEWNVNAVRMVSQLQGPSSGAKK